MSELSPGDNGYERPSTGDFVKVRIDCGTEPHELPWAEVISLNADGILTARIANILGGEHVHGYQLNDEITFKLSAHPLTEPAGKKKRWGAQLVRASSNATALWWAVKPPRLSQ